MVLPKSLTYIPDDLLLNSNKFLYVYATKGSYAYNWAVKNGFHVAECYYINYYLNGGVNGEGNPTAYEKGESLTFSKPTKKGYNFVGWFTDSNLSKPYI